MISTHELINRIRWDEAYAKGNFILGYYDRRGKKIIKVPFQEIYIHPGDHFFFQLMDADGYSHEVPFHRAKEVYKDSKLIWHRTHESR